MLVAQLGLRVLGASLFLLAALVFFVGGSVDGSVLVATVLVAIVATAGAEILAAGGRYIAGRRASDA